MLHLWQDVRYGIRMLLSKPGFTAAAVLVLALGIGANSAVFSLVNAFLLKPLHVQNPEQLAGLYSRDTKHPDRYRAFSYPNYVDIRDSNQAFSSLAAMNLAMVGVQEGETTRRSFAAVVSLHYFLTLGVASPEVAAPSTPRKKSSQDNGTDRQSSAYSLLEEARREDPELVGKLVGQRSPVRPSSASRRK